MAHGQLEDLNSTISSTSCEVENVSVLLKMVDTGIMQHTWLLSI
jgi:hypothetical protein